MDAPLCFLRRRHHGARAVVLSATLIVTVIGICRPVAMASAGDPESGSTAHGTSDAVFQDVAEELDEILDKVDAATDSPPTEEPIVENPDVAPAILAPVTSGTDESPDGPPDSSRSEQTVERSPRTNASAAAELESASEPRPARVAAKLPKASSKSRPTIPDDDPPSPHHVSKSVAVPQAAKLLRRPIEQALQLHVGQRLNSAENSCWSMMHAFLGWGAGTEIHVNGPRGRRVNAINWVGNNNPCAGRRIFYLENGRIKGREGPGYQGHPGQFLAMLAQCSIHPTQPLAVQGRALHVSDLIAEEKRSCRLGTELTFKLLALAHYQSTVDTWTSDTNEKWSLERLLADELRQPVNGVACGGTHRLMAISYAIAKRRHEGLPLDGTWAKADQYIRDYHRYTMTLANRDGSFSSDWFRKRSDWGDLDRRLQTTGHILEWLVFSLPDDSLYDERVLRAVNFLATSLARHRHHDWEVGPKGHAIRALRLFHQRVFQRIESPLAPVARQIDPSASQH